MRHRLVFLILTIALLIAHRILFAQVQNIYLPLVIVPGNATALPGTAAPTSATVPPSTTVPPDRTITPSTTVPPDRTITPSAIVPPSTTVSPSTTAPPSTTVAPSTTVSPDRTMTAVAPSPTVAPSATVAPSPTPPNIAITEIYPGEGISIADDLAEEFVAISVLSNTAIDISGWKLIKKGSNPRLEFVFPSFLMGSGENLEEMATLFTGALPPRTSAAPGEFYWNQRNPVWAPGDGAELYDAGGHLLASYTVSAP